MPRIMAPPPSGEFYIKLIKPFDGPATHTVEIIGEPNRSATVKLINKSNAGNELQKEGQMPADDVNELLSLTEKLRGFPSNGSKDLYGLDTVLQLQTFDIQWSNDEENAGSQEITLGEETKSQFKDIVESVDAAGRQFAKVDAAV